MPRSRQRTDSGPSRMGISEPGHGPAISPGIDSETISETGGRASRARLLGGMAHVPSYVSGVAGRYWCADDGSTATHASRQYSNDDEHLWKRNAEYEEGGES